MRGSQLTGKLRGLVVATAVMGTVACGEVARTGRSPAFVILERLEGASGAEPNEFGTVLFSDVQTVVKRQVAGVEAQVPTIFADLGRASFRVGLKNPGTLTSPTTPTSLNAVTLNRYRVSYKRSDGRNTQGVDVPYTFDGAMTITIPPDGPATGFFELVRLMAKDELPLVRLINGGSNLSFNAIADVTFFGHDQAGNEVSVTGSITVSFADFGDPE
jgi:hypothetical protein